MNKTYFNNNNGNSYEVLARYFDDVMLLKTESNNYIVARWIKGNEWGSGHYWLNNFEGAKNDFLEIAYTTYKDDNAWFELVSKDEFDSIYMEV